MESAAPLANNMNLSGLLYKTTITLGMASKMIQDNNDVTVKIIKNRVIRWKKFFETKLKLPLSMPLIVAELNRSLNYTLATAKRRGSGLRAELSKCPSFFISHRMYSLAWKKEIILDDGSKASLFSILKKGNEHK